MKWGTLYGPEYVNILYRAVRANLTGPFRFVCLTDDAEGFLPEVEAHPIPDLNLTEFQWYKGGWPKLSVFAEDLYGLSGRALFIDLDTMIVGPLDDLFEAGAFVAIDTGPTWGQPSPDGGPLCGTGIYVFDLGAHVDILERFNAERDGVIEQFRIEQLFVHHMVPEMTFWPADWVKSFKYHLRQPALVGLLVPPKAPAPEHRVIAFHGEPRPIDLVRRGVWGIGPNWGRGRVPWAVDYWTRYGGNPETD